MSKKVFLRIAALLILIHLLGHAMGHFSWDKPEDAGQQEVVKHMKSHAAEFMGATRSMADYYNGYSIILFGLYGMSIIVLWILSGAEENEKSVTVIATVFGVTFLFFSVVEWIYFFPFAASISGLAGAVIVASVFSKNKHAKL